MGVCDLILFFVFFCFLFRFLFLCFISWLWFLGCIVVGLLFYLVGLFIGFLSRFI